jgi:hypothetical protein
MFKGDIVITRHPLFGRRAAMLKGLYERLKEEVFLNEERLELLQEVTSIFFYFSSQIIFV